MFSDCPMPLYAGDGYCDYVNNINLCNFDGGDCVMNKNGTWQLEFGEFGVGSWGIFCLDTPYFAIDANYVGNGYCNDNANNEYCDYDGNDCCLPIILDDYCEECLCHEDGKRHQSSGNGVIHSYTIFVDPL